jgi:CRP-like cAMP-binding protein
MTSKSHFVSLLKEAFDPYFSAPVNAWEEFVDHCDYIKFSKDQIIKDQNTLERYFYFIIKGSAGLFLWKENTSVCLDFAFDGHFCTDYMSLLTDKPTPLAIIDLEPCEMLRMSKSNYNKITQSSIGKVIRLVAAEMSFVNKQQQQIELLTKTAKERYDLLLLQFPNIHNRVAQQHIASYLGITPQSLSRIRRIR